MESLTDAVTTIRETSWVAKTFLLAAATLVALMVAGLLRRSFVAIYWRRAAARSRRGDQRRQVDARKREQTIVKVIESLVRYAIFAVWLVFVLGVFSQSSTSAIFGASLLVVVAGFGAQALLADLVAGLFLLFEDRIAVGDVVRIPSTNIDGVVVDFGLRATTVRAADGTVSMVLNGAIKSLDRVSRGVRAWRVEVLVSEAEPARAAAERSLAQLPGPASAYLSEPTVTLEPMPEAHVSVAGVADDPGSNAPHPARLLVELAVAPTFDAVATDAYPVVLARELGPLAVDPPTVWPADARTLDSIRDTAIT